MNNKVYLFAFTQLAIDPVGKHPGSIFSVVYEEQRFINISYLTGSAQWESDRN